MRSLGVLRGGAKQAQFGCDVSPKVIILAGLSCGNLIFNDIFEDTKQLVTTPTEQLKAMINKLMKAKLLEEQSLKLIH